MYWSDNMLCLNNCGVSDAAYIPNFIWRTECYTSRLILINYVEINYLIYSIVDFFELRCFTVRIFLHYDLFLSFMIVG